MSRALFDAFREIAAAQAARAAAAAAADVADVALNVAVREVLAAACAIDAAEIALDDAIRAHGSAEGLIEGDLAWEAVHACKRALASAEERHFAARDAYDAAYRVYDDAMRARRAAQP